MEMVLFSIRKVRITSIGIGKSQTEYQVLQLKTNRKEYECIQTECINVKIHRRKLILSEMNTSNSHCIDIEQRHEKIYQ